MGGFPLRTGGIEKMENAADRTIPQGDPKNERNHDGEQQ
jgi:hypothetical protein